MENVTSTMKKVILLVVAIFIVVLTATTILSPALGDLTFNLNDILANDGSVKRAEEDLQIMYDKFMNDDGGLDSYEMSIILAKAVEETWLTCNRFEKACTNGGQLFQDFFDGKEFKVTNEIDCEAYRLSADYCRDIRSSVINANEWTVTVWGFKLGKESVTRLCSEEEREYGWENKECKDISGTTFEIAGQYCSTLCGKHGNDNLKWSGPAIKYDNTGKPYSVSVEFSDSDKSVYIIVNEI